MKWFELWPEDIFNISLHQWETLSCIWIVYSFRGHLHVTFSFLGAHFVYSFLFLASLGTSWTPRREGREWWCWPHGKRHFLFLHSFINSLISSHRCMFFCRALLVPLVLEVLRVQAEPMYVWLIYAPVKADIKSGLLVVPWKLSFSGLATYLISSVRVEN